MMYKISWDPEIHRDCESSDIQVIGNQSHTSCVEETIQLNLISIKQAVRKFIGRGEWKQLHIIWFCSDEYHEIMIIQAVKSWVTHLLQTLLQLRRLVLISFNCRRLSSHRGWIKGSLQSLQRSCCKLTYDLLSTQAAPKPLLSHLESDLVNA